MKKSLAILVVTLGASSCGGGGAADTLFGGSTAVTIRGTAASGRPLAGADVVVKDRNGRTYQTTTDANGQYAVSAPLTQLPRWPLVARVSGGTLGCGTRAGCTPSANAQSYVGVSLIGPGNVTMNLTPMSHATASAATRRDANALFAAPELLDPVNPLDLIDALFTVLDWLLRLDPTILLPRDIDFVGGVFVPVPGDNQDAFLDLFQSILAALFIDTPAFDLLVTTAPTTATPAAPIYCDIAGHYDGAYNGTSSGAWQIDIDATTGTIADATVDGSGTGVGAVTRTGTGAQRAQASWTATRGPTSFQGTVAAGATITGSWSAPAGARGSFTGQRTRAASGCR